MVKRVSSMAALLASLVLAAPVLANAQSSSRRRRHQAEQSTPAPTPEAATPTPGARPSPTVAPAGVSTIDPGDIEGWESITPPIRELLTAALELTRRNLTYKYGSDDPASGGMDCSGTISYLLKAHGFGDVPRDASQQYLWVRERSRVYPVLSKKQDNAELDELRAGDLLFWTGTYNIDRDPPVTHTMIYLGRRKSDGHRLMFGASDGRTYDGQKRYGVSVFDFRMPAANEGDPTDAATAAVPDHAPDFAGYGPIPGMADLNDAASRQTTAGRSAARGPAVEKDDEKPTPRAKASPTPRRNKRTPHSDN